MRTALVKSIGDVTTAQLVFRHHQEERTLLANFRALFRAF